MIAYFAILSKVTPILMYKILINIYSKIVIMNKDKNFEGDSAFRGTSKPEDGSDFENKPIDSYLENELQMVEILKGSIRQQRVLDSANRKLDKLTIHDVLEVELQEKLTTLSDLDLAVSRGEPGISLGFLITNESLFDGESDGEMFFDKVDNKSSIDRLNEILVYKLSGLPIRFLQHTVDYRLSPDTDVDSTGFVRSQNLLLNPEYWINQDDDIKGEKSNTLSCSYVDSEINIMHGAATSFFGVAYGFCRIEKNALIGVYKGDGQTANNVGRMAVSDGRYEVESLDELAYKSTSSYNEVFLRRFDINNQSLMPDFLITYDGFYSDQMVEHAKFFNVPVIDIERNSYVLKQLEIAKEKIQTINSMSQYDEILGVLNYLKFSSLDIDAYQYLSDSEEDESKSEILNNFFIKRFDEDEIRKIKEIFRLEKQKRPVTMKKPRFEDEDF